MPNAKQFTVYSDTTTKCKQHFTRDNAYCKLKVMIGIILFKTVRAFGFKIEPSLITCCYNFVKILILKKSLCFPQVGSVGTLVLSLLGIFLPEFTMCSSISAFVNSGIFSREVPQFSSEYFTDRTWRSLEKLLVVDLVKESFLRVYS